MRPRFKIRLRRDKSGVQARVLDRSQASEWLLIALALSVSAMVLYPGWPLAVAMGSVCLLGGIFRWNWLWYSLLFFLPLAPLLKSDLPFEDLTSVLRIVAAVGVFVGYLLRRESLPFGVFKSKLSVAALVYVFVVAISAAKNGISPIAHHSVFHLFSYVMFYFGAVAWITTGEQLHSAARTLVASGIGVSLFGMYQFVIGGYSDLYFQLYPDQAANLNWWDGRVTSFLNYSNCLGGYMAIIAAFSLAVGLLDTDMMWRKLGQVGFVLSAITILFSQSRGALAGFLMVVLLAVVSFAKGWKIRAALFFGTVMLLMLAIPLLADFSQHLTVKAQDTSLIGRMIVFASAASLFLKSPIVGVGYGNFRNLMDFDVFDLQANSWDAHNLYLQLLAETGILGFLSFGSLALLALWYARKLFRGEFGTGRLVGFATLTALCSVLTHGCVDYLFNASSQFGTLFWFILAMIAATWALRNSNAASWSAQVQETT